MFSFFLTTIHLLLSIFLSGIEATVSFGSSAFLHAGRHTSIYCHHREVSVLCIDEHPMLTSSRIGTRLIAQAIVRNTNNYRSLVRGTTMSITAQSFNNEQLQDKQRDSSTTDTDQQQQQHRPLVIVLAGPTAVGKSDVAAKLCSPEIASDIARGHYNASSTNNNDSTTTTIYRGHVISADSVQAYRGVDIGANKPTIEEMECTTHHLVNVVNPPSDPTKAASYNAADWMGDASYVIDKLVGGSFNYINEDIGSDDINADNLNHEIDGVNIDDDSALHDRRVSINKALEQSVAKSKNENEKILPVVVGGTMMYLQWLVHGRPDAIRPTEGAIKRAAEVIYTFQQDVESSTHDEIEMIERNNSSSDNRGGPNETNTEQDEENDIAAWKAASTYVSSLGPVFAQRVEKLPGRDWYRLRRLLEVAYTIVSKKKKATTKNEGQDTANKSEEEILLQLTEKEVYTGIRSGSLSDLGYDVRCFFLCPTDRMAHFHIVDERCEQMLLRGLLSETANLYASGGLPDDSQVTRAIGYRQTLEYLKRKSARPNDHEAFMSFIDNFATATRQYAKKQMQWYFLFSCLIRIQIYCFFVLISRLSFFEQVSTRCRVCIYTSTDGG